MNSSDVQQPERMEKLICVILHNIRQPWCRIMWTYERESRDHHKWQTIMLTLCRHICVFCRTMAVTRGLTQCSDWTDTVALLPTQPRTFTDSTCDTHHLFALNVVQVYQRRLWVELTDDTGRMGAFCTGHLNTAPLDPRYSPIPMQWMTEDMPAPSLTSKCMINTDSVTIISSTTGLNKSPVIYDVSEPSLYLCSHNYVFTFC